MNGFLENMVNLIQLLVHVDEGYIVGLTGLTRNGGGCEKKHGRNHTHNTARHLS